MTMKILLALSLLGLVGCEQNPCQERDAVPPGVPFHCTHQEVGKTFTCSQQGCWEVDEKGRLIVP